MKIAAFLLFVMLAWITPARADYAEQMNVQIMDIEERFSKIFSPGYFHDMGIIARKADDAQLPDLTLQIAREKLLARMDDYVKSEIDEINRIYETDALTASRRLAALNRFERYYEPSENFLKTAGGQTLAAELALQRKNALSMLTASCSETSILQGLQGMKKTGLFQTRHAEEINSMREITRLLDCCLGWKSRIDYYSEQDFKSEYEEGLAIEEAHLQLQTGARDLNQAVWTGEWIYRFSGRDGKGEGKSSATLRYRRGDETAELVISASRLSSVGRINFPTQLEGEPRTLDVDSRPVFPKARFSSSQEIALAGCPETKT